MKDQKFWTFHRMEIFKNLDRPRGFVFIYGKSSEIQKGIFGRMASLPVCILIYPEVQKPE